MLMALRLISIHICASYNSIPVPFLPFFVRLLSSTVGRGSQSTKCHRQVLCDCRSCLFNGKKRLLRLHRLLVMLSRCSRSRLTGWVYCRFLCSTTTTVVFIGKVWCRGVVNGMGIACVLQALSPCPSCRLKYFTGAYA